MKWLMKSEPSVYSIDHFAKDKKTWWEGVRNYQARNFMMNDMKVGDEFLFYHSNAEPSAAVGIGRVCAVAAPDLTQFDKKSEYFDPKATKEKPIWFCVQVEFVKKFSHPVTLADIKSETALSKMLLVQKGSRLSVMPVTDAEYRLILQMAGR
jgi:predicted RNA-binding protein with PUA-like domain